MKKGLIGLIIGIIVLIILLIAIAGIVVPLLSKSFKETFVPSESVSEKYVLNITNLKCFPNELSFRVNDTSTKMYETNFHPYTSFRVFVNNTPAKIKDVKFFRKTYIALITDSCDSIKETYNWTNVGLNQLYEGFFSGSDTDAFIFATAACSEISSFSNYSMALRNVSLAIPPESETSPIFKVLIININQQSTLDTNDLPNEELQNFEQALRALQEIKFNAIYILAPSITPSTDACYDIYALNATKNIFGIVEKDQNYYKNKEGTYFCGKPNQKLNHANIVQEIRNNASNIYLTYSYPLSPSDKTLKVILKVKESQETFEWGAPVKDGRTECNINI
ncbi:MAG: hypothetical protein QW625_01650 [Candidatus Nanoarchaeia archaeon]